MMWSLNDEVLACMNDIVEGHWRECADVKFRKVLSSGACVALTLARCLFFIFFY